MGCDTVNCASTTFPIPRIAEATTARPQASSPGPSTPSTIPVLAHLFTSQSHPILVQTDIYGGERLGAINHRAVTETTLSAGTPYSVHPAYSGPLSEEQKAHLRMRETWSACFVFNRCVLKMVLDLANILLGWLCELLGQKSASQGRHAVPAPEFGEVIETKDEDDEAVVYGSPPPVKWSTRE